MKTGLKIAALLWAAFMLFIGFSMFLDTPNRIQRNKDFVEKHIKPSVDFINKFKKVNGRLPSNREYYTWYRDSYKDYTNDLKQEVDSLIPGLGSRQYIRHTTHVVSGDQHKFRNADWTKDYALGVWNGSFWEYYYSWSDEYETNSYSWKDGYIGLGEMATLSLIPILLWLFNSKKRKKAANDTV